MPIILKDITFSYPGQQPILENFSYRFPLQGCMSITGKSGSGKTTLLRLIAGLERPQKGTIEKPENLKISFVFQEDRLLPFYTVKENIKLVCREENAAGQALEAVGLKQAEKAYPESLSGGMRRKVAIARALAFNGDVLLLDEPFSGLDETSKQQIAKAIRKQFEKKLIILVSHIAQDAEILGAKEPSLLLEAK